MWSRWRAPSAGSKSSTTRSARPAERRRWCRSTSRTIDGIDRLAAALDERYGRLDMLVGNAGILGPISPLGHVEPKAWDEVMAVNVTANWQLIRSHGPAAAARPMPGARCSSPPARPSSARAYCGPYAVVQGGARGAGAHLRGRDRIDHGARQSVQSRPDPHAHARRGHARRGSDDTADAGAGRARRSSSSACRASPRPASSTIIRAANARWTFRPPAL